MRPPKPLLALIVVTLALLARPASGAGPLPEAGAWVRLHHEQVLELRAPMGDVPAERRAREASRALAAALEAAPEVEPAVELGPDGAALRLGATTVLRLGPADAAAEGAALEEVAGRALDRLRVAVDAERRRRAAHEAVYQWSMVVFSGLVSLLVVRWIGRYAVATAARIEAAETSVVGLGLGGVELASGAAVRTGAAFALRLGRFVAQAAVVAAWVLSVLSRFQATQASRVRITAALLDGASSIGGQVARAVPFALAGAVGLGLVVLLVRGAGVFFEAVARGETAPGWLPRDLARPLGGVVRTGLVVVALLLGAAVAGGDGLLGGLARAVVLALGLAGAPLAASALAGLPLLLGRVVRPGDLIELGGQRGRVVEIGLLATVLEGEGGARVRVPHLLSLLRPTTVHGRGPGAGA